MSRLNWPNFQQRRRTTRLTVLRKMKNNLVHTEVLAAESYSRSQVVSEEATAINHNHSAAHSTEFSFLPRTTEEWNELPLEAAAADTLDTFVSRAC